MKTPNVNSWWNNLVTNFVFRMMISGLLLSIFWGGVVYIYQTHQVKKELFQQLEKASRNLISGQSVPLNKMDTRVFNKIIEISARQLTDFRIVMLDLYDVGHLSIFHYDNGSEDIKAVEGQKTKLKATPFSDQNEHLMFKFKDEFYFQVFSPIHDDQQFLGYVDILVAVGPKILHQFRKALIIALFHAIGTISTMTLVLFPLIHSSYRKLRRNSRELLKSNLYTIKALGNAIAKRDSETGEHNHRVTYFSLCLAEQLHLSNQSMQSLIKGAFLHDIGKIGIRDNILLKPSSLSNDEFTIMKTHVEQGVQIVNDIPWLRDSIDVIRFHHEKYDGSGYPMGIIGEQIPIVARIFSMVDVFDALNSKRPYKHAMSYVDTIEILKQNQKQFDPLVFAAFLEISESQYKDAAVMVKPELEICLAEKIHKYFDI
ncbi:hypothetical protein DSCO28_14860 [Desulfosarcina ovata subsp. sediminis]|uniref:HD-GYP domain-containing protein n=2 Tax=Desulfosarcina ovata TaxID=83564 RepID=A0A5K7ZPK8_9BACT|nr:hypothetical protein DSCO28_14860 [Desulfosarcina ovata subsp. sediminis]